MLAAVNGHLFLVNSKLSWAQDDFVNANKVFLTKDTKKCTQWELGYISQWQLSKEGIKCLLDRDCLDQVKGCSDKNQKTKNSVIVIRSDQDGFLHATRETEMYLNSKGCLIFLPNFTSLLCIFSLGSGITIHKDFLEFVSLRSIHLIVTDSTIYRLAYGFGLFISLWL